MSLSIESIDLFVRRLPPNRMEFGIGTKSAEGEVKAATKRRPDAMLLVRATLSIDGRQVTGCSGDRPSFGWLDKRAEKTPEAKLHDLLDLLEVSRGIWLEEGRGFETPFELWRRSYARVQAAAGEAGHEELSGSYASALIERALIDAVCKADGRSFFEMLKEDRLGVDAGSVHPELKGMLLGDCLPVKPRRRLFIRHTVGHSDPLVEADLSPEDRVNDGEPETLEAYARRDGLRFFKVKISGDAKVDLARLKRIWKEVLVHLEEPAVTLDGNEAYSDLDAFAGFVETFSREIPGLFEHTLFIEQPLTRALTMDEKTRKSVARISAMKDLVIDEADGTVASFKTAFGIGYAGTSHKNCKGVFKSLLNHLLCAKLSESTGRRAFMTAEDLSNMPMVPLHQDFAVVSALGIAHCERNGHHYAFGLSHLGTAEKERLAEAHPDLYVKRGDEWFLDIKDGAVDITSLLVRPGLGGDVEPDWQDLMNLEEWRKSSTNGESL